MTELRWLCKAGTSTTPAKLQYRTFDPVDGWNHSTWSSWKDVPNVVEGSKQDQTVGEDSVASDEVAPGGSVTRPVGLPGFYSGSDS